LFGPLRGDPITVTTVDPVEAKLQGPTAVGLGKSIVKVRLADPTEAGTAVTTTRPKELLIVVP
jgi:hypothetical protein